MSAAGRDRHPWNDLHLHAYHDGELRGLARWRFERRLRRSPELRRELSALRLVRQLAREGDAEAATPDLWEGIARRLPAADAAAREEERPAGIGGPVWAGWWKPVGAVAAAAAAVAAVLWLPAGGPVPGGPSGGVVRWVDGGGHTVAVLESDPETTIIWVLDDAKDAAREGGERAFI